EVRLSGDPLKQPASSVPLELVPAHMGHFQVGEIPKADDLPRNDSEPFPLSVFVADLHQQLQTEANPQKRLVRGNVLLERGLEALAPDLVNRVAKCANSRQH